MKYYDLIPHKIAYTKSIFDLQYIVNNITDTYQHLNKDLFGTPTYYYCEYDFPKFLGYQKLQPSGSILESSLKSLHYA